MNLLVTAGGTIVPIDRVRFISNGFTGRTGSAIGRAAHDRGHSVTLLTSHPQTAGADGDRWRVRAYRTFDDLHGAMAECLTGGGFDAVIHSAAVSDYRVGGVFAPAGGTALRDGVWVSDGAPKMIDQSAGKVKSNFPELWLRLVKAPKLVDLIRRDWKFAGVLVKFKLEVDVSDERLLEIAERSRLHSDADLMVANTLDGAKSCAFLGPLEGKFERIERAELPRRLIEAVERNHG